MVLLTITKSLQKLHLQLRPSQVLVKRLKISRVLTDLSESGKWFQILALSYRIVLVPNVAWFTLDTFISQGLLIEYADCWT